MEVMRDIVPRNGRKDNKAANAHYIFHTPVLLEETIKYLAPRKSGELMVDATVGEGGHSNAFLSQFPELKIIGVDADPDILKIARERLKRFGERLQFYSGWSHDF